MDQQLRGRRLGRYLVCMPPSICPTLGIAVKSTILQSKHLLIAVSDDVYQVFRTRPSKATKAYMSQATSVCSWA
jgi:hypothetical protein